MKKKRGVVDYYDRLVSASWDDTLKVWDLSNPEAPQCVATLQGHTKNMSQEKGERFIPFLKLPGRSYSGY